eukprot:m.18521 g.18521  ORF g.18521 m.18521 type:complete len:428 (-) comp12058_c0_seq1:256-1539(-)
MSNSAEEILQKASKKYGSQTPFAEPAWYNEENVTPYYNEHHKVFRGKVRKFVDEVVMPNIDKWEADNCIPPFAFKLAAEVGIQACLCGWPIDTAGPRPEGFDLFFCVIAFDEISRCGSGGVVWGLTGGIGIGLPPVAHFGEDNLKELVVGPVLRGEKTIALAVSEPTAGSDVANIATTAVEDGDFYIVNGLKKWITCGMFADFFTVAVRTGDEGSGMMGVELLLIEKTRPGVSVRAMDCMGAKGSGTAYVEFDDVRVPVDNLIGDVTCLLKNFVTERLGLALQANRFARVCLAESIEHIRRRKAFGKKLEDQPVVRYKIANMARRVESTHAFLESLAYRAVAMDRDGGDWIGSILRYGAEAALAKVQATDTFEYCAREAAHLHGGNSYVKGNKIESLYRHVLSLSIPGGATDVMLDAAARLSLKGKF